MSIRQTLTSAQNGTIWSRKEGGKTYFLRKIANKYEVWTSLDSGSKRTVTIDQAVTFYSQHNLVNATTAARPEPAAPTRPAPPPPPPPARPSADQRLQSIRNGGGIINVNANLSIIYEDGQYLSFNPRNASLADIRLRTAAEIKNGNASPITIAQAKAAITNGAKTTTSAPTTTATPPPPPKPKAKPAPVSPSITPAPKPEPKPVDKPKTTTSPSNKLPLGDDIADIYDPNLTPEQIASLSPGDRQTRADVLASKKAGDDLVVTGTREEEARTIAAQQDQIAFEARNDWRVRLALTDDTSANYLYKSDNPGILAPLASTNGVLFPYTPTISVNYAASYNATDLVHSNYKVYQYSNSSVDQVTITCDFTAQDTAEANYLLAVIHFFRSMTKMFYGQDSNPRRGTPPPLCYMFGMGNYQFAAHPLAITGFSYNLPNTVDYIKTISPSDTGISQPAESFKPFGNSLKRLAGTGADSGGTLPPVDFTQLGYSGEPDTVSWVPTQIQISVSCLPMMSRNQVSNKFSLKDYATGALLNGIGKQGGGFW